MTHEKVTGDGQFFMGRPPRNEAQLWNSKNNKDSLEYLNGITLHREFFEWNEGFGFKLNIGTKNGKKSKVSRVALQSGFDELNSKFPPPPLFKIEEMPTPLPSSTFFLAFAFAVSGLDL